MDGNGEKVSDHIKASKIDDKIGVKALDRKIAKDAPYLKDKARRDELAGRIRSVVEDCRKADNLNQANVTRTLEQAGVTPVFRKNEEGRIYGATFIDHREGAVYNGSKLGKDFAANAWHKLFAEAGQIPPETVKGTTQPEQTYPQQIEFPVPDAEARKREKPETVITVKSRQYQRKPFVQYEAQHSAHSYMRGGMGLLDQMLLGPEVIEEIDPAFAPDWMIPKNAKKKVKKKVIKVKK